MTDIVLTKRESDDVRPSVNNVPASETPSKRIEYRVEYRHMNTNKVVHSISADRSDFDIYVSGGRSIIDIVTIYKTSDEEFQSENSEANPRVSDTRKRVDMHIHSPAIIHALRSVVKYYPGQELFGESITIAYPYPILVHHETELAEYRERCSPENQKQNVCSREKDAYQDIGILQEYLEQTVMPAVRDERERNTRGFETFEMCWLRMKPGLSWKVVKAGAALGQPTQCVIESLENGALGFGSEAWLIKHWSLEYNGKYIGTIYGESVWERFAGEQKIPLDSEEILDEDAFNQPLTKSVNAMVADGRKFFNLLTKQCQRYKGTTVGDHQKNIDSLVMVDMKTYYNEVTLGRIPPVTFLQPDKSWVTDCSCSVCQQRKEISFDNDEPFAEYHGIYPEDHSELSAHMYFLLPSKLYAFVFKTRTWEELAVKSFQEPNFQQNMIDKLVMDPVRIRTLKALASSYIRENIFGQKSEERAWSADFVQGKGQGQIILLHGKPGVGKTCTAECIAEFTKRPLMVLTSSDIGANPAEVENILVKSFKRASEWGAVLLIDEADVFMERRSTNDLTRNVLVAGFLRALEFYDGILFLTTNRIGAFDDAFISRIHIQLYYPEFTDEERHRVWQTFIDKLIKERGSSFRVSLDAKDYIKGKQMREIKWNGREIRNAFQTAVALAEYDAEKDEEGKILLKDTHLSSIVDMSRGFKDYISKVHGADEDKRAAQGGNRYDY